MRWTNILQQHNDNGNMTRKEAGQGVMAMAWDDENRLLEVKNEGNEVSRYRYGHDGERILKSTPDGQTTYVNEYLTIRSVRGADGSQAVRSRVATKHIFAGSERVATKRVDSTGTKLAESLFNKANCNASANSVIGFFVDVFMRNKTSCPNTNASESLFTNESAVVEEKEAYFYHSDHLGSIGIVTRDGELHDYTVFLPFGEQWIFQSTNQAANDQTANGDGLNPLSPFQFTGKELDKYTGLTYFGARYYDPRVSVWLSADPVLEGYLAGEGISGGMFSSKNMNLYAYSWNNPINITDPDGREVDATVNLDLGNLVVLDKDQYNPNLPNVTVSADQYNFEGVKDKDGNQTHNQLLLIKNVFSGGEADEQGSISRNEHDLKQRALPNGDYDILEYDGIGGKSDWLKLDAIDSDRYNDIIDDGISKGRGQFRLHRGSLSHGCVTVCDATNSRSEEFKTLHKIINQTSKSRVPKRENNQKYIPFTSRNNYGTLHVRGKSNE